ncbi:MAG TPA: SDR family NAD(P)-dependent oxidoreductase [Alphaproteobacteria bacterium]|nr:SDR family NAD(P)-dependent oxidoreductase [Alphaproteobacteria bacterium]
MGSLSNRIAVVTGASRGLGRAAALAIAKEGAHIIAMARTVGGLEELDDEIKAAGGSATLVPADLRDFDAHDRLGKAIFDRWGKLDILVLNGAILGPVTPLTHISPAQWSETLDVNVTANWRLLRSLDLLLKRSDAARVIGVTSGVVKRPRAYVGAYGITKTAFEMMMRIYAIECENTDVRVNILDPGIARTKMRATLVPGEDPMSVPLPEEIAPLFVELAKSSLTLNGQIALFPEWKKTGKLG